MAELAGVSDREIQRRGRTARLIRSLTRPKLYIAYLFLLPALAILVMGLAVPLLNAFELSLHDWSMGIPWESREYIGFSSYERMFADDRVHTSLGVTLRFAFWVMLLEMILGTALALYLEKPVRGAPLFRTIFILPLMVSPVVVGLIWRYLYDARVGLIDFYLERIGQAIPFLQSLGFIRQDWLGDPNLALASIIITDIWQWTPFIFIIILGGLQGLPGEVMDAALIDGANKFQMTILVKLPMLRSILLVTFLMRLIDVFRALEVMYVMTFGGPGLSTELFSLHIYKTAFTSQELGYAATLSTLLLAILLAISLFILLFANPLKERTDF